jgi:hypothetical protein
VTRFFALRRLAAVVVPVVLAATPGAAWAQGGGSTGAGSERPFRGLFSGAGPQGERSVTLSGSMFGAYDDNVVAAITGQGGRSLDPRLQESGFYEGASAMLGFRDGHTGERLTWGTSAAAGAYAYHTDDWTTRPRFSGGADMQYQLSRATILSAGYSLSYSSNYRLELFPDALGGDADGAILDDPDTAIVDRDVLHQRAMIALSKRLDSRSTLTGGYIGRFARFVDDDVPSRFGHAASIAYDRRLTSHATLNLGYGYRTSRSRGSRPAQVQNINAGVSYSRALSFSRATSLNFSTGSAVLSSDAIATDTGSRTRFRVVGSAALTHELGRSWTTFLSYQRRFVFREAFVEPFFTDAVSGGVIGLITRRIDVSGRVGYSTSTVGTGASNGHRGVLGTAQARYAFTRYLAAYARYIYYQYRIGDDVEFAEGFDVPRSLDRNGIRVGISASVPILR